MKKIIALSTMSALMLAVTPMAGAQESAEEAGFLTALGNLTGMENYSAAEVVEGSLKINEFGDDFTVNFTVNSDTRVDGLATANELMAEIEVVNNGEVEPYFMSFETMNIMVGADILSMDENGLYATLNEFDIEVTGAYDEGTASDIEFAETMAQPFIGIQYYLPLNDFPSHMTMPLDMAQLKNNFSENPEQAIRDFVEEIATQGIKQQSFYSSLYGWDEMDEYIDFSTVEDPRALIAEKGWEVLPADLEVLVEKGAMECQTQADIEAEMEEIRLMYGEDEAFFFESTTIDNLGEVEDGFLYDLACYTSYPLNDENLSESEQYLMDHLDFYTGDWLMEAGELFYVVTRDPGDEFYFGDNYITFLEEGLAAGTAVEVDFEAGIEKGYLECNTTEDEVTMVEEMIEWEGGGLSEGAIEEMREEALNYVPGYLDPNAEEGAKTWPGCWVVDFYAGDDLTEAEQVIVDASYTGDFVFHEGTWFYIAGIHEDYSQRYEEEMAALEAYEIPEAELEEGLVGVRAGLDIFFDADLFYNLDIVNGQYEGAEFFSLRKSGVVNMMQEMYLLMEGEEMDEVELEEVNDVMNGVNLTGIYDLDEGGDYLDMLYVNFGFLFEDTYYDGETSTFEMDMNYAFKVTDPTATNDLEAPEEFEDLSRLLMSPLFF